MLMYDQSTYVSTSTFIYSICWVFSGNTDASTWPVVFKMSFPFDTKTIIGWYLLLIYTTCRDLAYIICLSLGTTQFIGLCIYIVAICDHFDSVMQMVQTNIEQNLHEKNPGKFIETNAKINAQINKAIEVHIQIYE